MMPRMLAIAAAAVASTSQPGSAVAVLAAPKDATKELKQLDVVHQALEKIEHMPMSADQKKFADKTVADVESTLADLEKNTKLTKAERQAKVKGAIEKMEGLQSQWELASVELALHKVLSTPGAPPTLLAHAKKVVGDVDAVVEQLESGKLPDGPERNAKVGAAIQALVGLEQEWAKVTGAGGKLQQLEQQLAEKKAQLAKTEKELKLASLEKELVEKKEMLARMVEQKHEQEAQQKQRQEDAAQQEMVAQLLAAAKSAASAAPKAAAGKKVIAAAAESKTVEKASFTKDKAIVAILSSLKAQAKNVSDSIALLDADEKKREAELEKTMKAPITGKKDAIAKGQAMLKMLVKREHRNYQKARALRESELQELTEGIRSVEKGDVKALTKLMGKMQSESKTLQAKSKNFLY